MTQRQIQLGSSLCDQDHLILQLFHNQAIRYVGSDLEFAKMLIQDHTSQNLILIINRPIWCSEIISLCKQELTSATKNFYVGINRYHIKGNDTSVEFDITQKKGQDIIDFINLHIQKLGYLTAQSGHFDFDLGRYFNFVQPLTWLYGYKQIAD